MAKREIRNFLLVIGSGVLVALLFVFWMVRVEGHDRGIYVYEILLSPNTMERISQDYKVESIDYSYNTQGKWEMLTLDMAPYKELWSDISGDRGSTQVDPDIVKLFDDPKLSTLAIYVRKEMPYQKDGLNVLFQQMQVPPHGDYYRIQMHEEDNKGNWVYFYHPGVQKIIIDAVKRYG